MARVESSGLAKTGAVTGITSLALLGAGALSGNGNGFLGGLFGGNNRCGEEAMQSALLATISGLQGQLGQASAERYADNVGSSVFDRAIQLSNRNDDRINANVEKIFSEQIVTRERLAAAEAREACMKENYLRTSAGLEAVQKEIADMRVREQATSDAINCLAQSTEQRFHAVYKEMKSAIELESERRTCSDQNIMQYVNATFVPGELVMPKSRICPEVMQRYNTWAAPEGTAPQTQPVSGTINVNK